MHVQYSPAQQHLRQEFRAYLAQLMTPEVREAVRDRESGSTYRRAPQAHGPGRLAHSRLAQGIRRSRARSPGAEDHSRGTVACGGAVSVRDRQHHRTGPDPARHARAEARHPAAHRQRRAQLRRRLQRGAGGHRPCGAARPRRCATGNSSSSTARRSSPAAPRARTTYGSRRAPMRVRPRTAASPFSWSTPGCRASRSHRSTRWVASAPMSPTTRTYASR